MGYDKTKNKWFVRPWKITYGFFGGSLNKPGMAIWFDTSEDATEYMNDKTRELYAQTNNIYESEKK